MIPDRDMETYAYPQFPFHVSVVNIALYTAVRNASLLRARIIKAATIQGVDGKREREAVNFAFVDASLVSMLNLDSRVKNSFWLAIRLRVVCICRRLYIKLF